MIKGTQQVKKKRGRPRKDAVIEPTSKLRADFSVVPLPGHPEPNFVEKTNSDGIVNWGGNNDFPEYLWSIFERCTTLQSALVTYVDFTVGNEIINNTSWTGINTCGDYLEDVVRKCIMDLWIFGGFCIQVLYNQEGEIHSLVYIDIRNFRTNDDFSEYFIYIDREANGRFSHVGDTMSFAPFGTLTKEERGEVGEELFYYKGTRSKNYYPIPDYFAALISAETQIEIKRFHYNNISNGMLAATIINFNDAENVTDENKEIIERAIKEKFGGARGAGEILISWNCDKEHDISITKLTDDNFDSKFNNLAESTREDLFISLRANPQLLGMAVNTGLQTQEFNELYETTNRLVIVPKQNEIKRAINKIFDMDDAIEFEEYSLPKQEGAEEAEGEEGMEGGEGEEAPIEEDVQNEGNFKSNINRRSESFTDDDGNRQKHLKGRFTRGPGADTGTRYRIHRRNTAFGSVEDLGGKWRDRLKRKWHI